MNFKWSPGFILGFPALLFLMHECHEWLHIIVARDICGCWGIKKFDYWTICDQCKPTTFQHAIILLAGPMVNYIVIWTAWLMMKPQNPPYKKSLGFSLFFATLPLPRILAALQGGSDETLGIKLLFSSGGVSHHHLEALTSLVLIILLSLPALIRALLLIQSTVGRWIVVPAFLIIPLILDRWIIGIGMNKLSATGFLATTAFAGTSWLLVIWFCLNLAIVWLERQKLFGFLIT